MLFYPVGEGGVWEALVQWEEPATLQLTQGGVRTFRPVDTLNPNLDGRVYEIYGAGQLLNRKAPRISAPQAGFDFRSSPRLDDFAQSALAKFFFIGMNDFFDESLCLAALLMRSPTVGRWRMLHRSSASVGYTLSARMRSRLEHCYGPEIEFYEKRRAEFLSEYAEELLFLKVHVGSLRIV